MKKNFKNKRKLTKGQIKAFNDGMIFKSFKPKNKDERNSYERGKAIGRSNDYLMAEYYTVHMNRKFGLFDNNGNLIRDKYGRALGCDNKPLPSAYKNYKSMKKDKELRQYIRENYS